MHLICAMLLRPDSFMHKRVCLQVYFGGGHREEAGGSGAEVAAQTQALQEKAEAIKSEGDLAGADLPEPDMSAPTVQVRPVALPPSSPSSSCTRSMYGRHAGTAKLTAGSTSWSWQWIQS